MTDFPLHDKDTAPEKSRPLLDNSLKAFGMIPGLHAVMGLCEPGAIHLTRIIPVYNTGEKGIDPPLNKRTPLIQIFKISN